MADNPKLVIELVDKGTTSPGYQGAAPGGGSAPYDYTAAQHQRITEQGLPPPSSYVPTAPLPLIGTTPTTQALGAASSPITNADVLASLFPDVMSKEEAQKFLKQIDTKEKQPNIKSEQELDAYLDPYINDFFRDKIGREELDRVRKAAYDSFYGIGSQGERIGETPYKPNWVFYEPPKEPEAPPIPIEPEAPPVAESYRTGERVRQSQITPEQKFQAETERVNEAVRQGFLNREQADRYIQDQQAKLPKQPVEDANNTNQFSIGQAQYAVSSLANAALGGTPLGGVAQAGVGVLGAVGSAIVTPGVGTGIGLMAAGFAAEAAVVGAVINEANRAVAITRQYSPEVAVAEGLAEVRRIQAELRTTATLGDESAAYITARSQLSSAAQGLRDTAAEPILQVLNENIEGLARVLQGIDNLLENNPFFKEAAQGSIEVIARGLSTMATGGIDFSLINKVLAKWIDLDANNKDNFSEKWFNDNFPHLDPPAPFKGDEQDMPVGVQLAPIPGLQL